MTGEPTGLEAGEQLRRHFLARGEDKKAARLGELLTKIKNGEAEVAEAQAKRALYKEVVAILECGMRSPAADRAELEDYRRHPAIQQFVMTPSERLRYMLTLGRRVLHEDPSMVDYQRAEAWVEKRFGSLNMNEPTRLHLPRRVQACARWAAAGGNRFTVTADLAAALLLTEAPEDAGAVPFPYSTFAVTVPPNVVPVFVPVFVPEGGATRTEWADTLWIERDGDTMTWIARWREIEVHHYNAMRTEDLDAGLSLNEDEVTFTAAFRLVHNFCFWLAAEGGLAAHRAEHVAPKLAEKRRRTGEEWPRDWIFGKSVKVGPELRRAASELALGRSPSHAVDGWKVRARFTVRGHWRNQAHGAGRALRTRKWIAPFWKGPSEREAWAHLYEPRGPA